MLSMMAVFVAPVVINSATAQNEVSLSDYLNDEPAQATLDSSEMNAQQIDNTAGSYTGDALPTVNQAQTQAFGDEQGMDVSLSERLGVVEQTPEQLAEEIRQEAYDAAITGLFPLSKNNIKDLITTYDETQRVVQTPLHGFPVPEVKVQTVSLDPGVVPLTLKTAVGHVTTLNILDVTGAPWPIQDVSWAGDFEVTEPEEGGHVIRVTPMAVAAYGNMSIRLLTLKTPVTIALRTDKNSVQYRVDARIPEYGPYAATPLIQGGSERVAGNALINAVLDGTPPGEAVTLAVSGVDGRTTAYKVGNMTYVRTPLTLLSPGWETSVSSADGMNVYGMKDTPVLLLSDRGRFSRASLKVQEDLFDE